jgi:hypothetical protein
MKTIIKALTFTFMLLALAAETQAQCHYFYYQKSIGVTDSVLVCDDGDIPSFAISTTSDGYKVTYDIAGVDFTTLGAYAADINDLDHNLCNCADARVSRYGYCGSDKGVANLSYTCSMAPNVYNLWVDPPSGRTTVNLELWLFMGITSDGARHSRHHKFTVAYNPPAAPPVVPAPAPVKGKGSQPKKN